jgi:hypothetical protein
MVAKQLIYPFYSRIYGQSQTMVRTQMTKGIVAMGKTYQLYADTLQTKVREGGSSKGEQVD